MPGGNTEDNTKLYFDIISSFITNKERLFKILEAAGDKVGEAIESAKKERREERLKNIPADLGTPEQRQKFAEDGVSFIHANKIKVAYQIYQIFHETNSETKSGELNKNKNERILELFSKNKEDIDYILEFLYVVGGLRDKLKDVVKFFKSGFKFKDDEKCASNPLKIIQNQKKFKNAWNNDTKKIELKPEKVGNDEYKREAIILNAQSSDGARYNKSTVIIKSTNDNNSTGVKFEAITIPFPNARVNHFGGRHDVFKDDSTVSNSKTDMGGGFSVVNVLQHPNNAKKFIEEYLRRDANNDLVFITTTGGRNNYIGVYHKFKGGLYDDRELVKTVVHRPVTKRDRSLLGRRRISGGENWIKHYDHPHNDVIYIPIKDSNGQLFYKLSSNHNGSVEYHGRDEKEVPQYRLSSPGIKFEGIFRIEGDGYKKLTEDEIKIYQNIGMCSLKDEHIITLKHHPMSKANKDVKTSRVPYRPTVKPPKKARVVTVGIEKSEEKKYEESKTRIEVTNEEENYDERFIFILKFYHYVNSNKKHGLMNEATGNIVFIENKHKQYKETLEKIKKSVLNPLEENYNDHYSDCVNTDGTLKFESKDGAYKPNVARVDQKDKEALVNSFNELLSKKSDSLIPLVTQFEQALHFQDLRDEVKKQNPRQTTRVPFRNSETDVEYDERIDLIIKKEYVTNRNDNSNVAKNKRDEALRLLTRGVYRAQKPSTRPLFPDGDNNFREAKGHIR